jgi:hypothetical protein
LGEVIYQGGAGHFYFSVDDHGAGAADFFEAVGVVRDGRGFLPSRVTGFSAMSRRQMMMFMEGRQRRENSSQWAGWPGEDWRLILSITFFSAMSPR